MRNNPSKRGATTNDCCSHIPGEKSIFIGLLLFLAGATLKSGYGIADVFVTVGLVVLLKGILVVQMNKGRIK